MTPNIFTETRCNSTTNTPCQTNNQYPMPRFAEVIVERPVSIKRLYGSATLINVADEVTCSDGLCVESNWQSGESSKNGQQHKTQVVVYKQRYGQLR